MLFRLQLKQWRIGPSATPKPAGGVNWDELVLDEEEGCSLEGSEEGSGSEDGSGLGSLEGSCEEISLEGSGSGSEEGSGSGSEDGSGSGSLEGSNSEEGSGSGSEEGSGAGSEENSEELSTIEVSSLDGRVPSLVSSIEEEMEEGDPPQEARTMVARANKKEGTMRFIPLR